MHDEDLIHHNRAGLLALRPGSGHQKWKKRWKGPECEYCWEALLRSLGATYTLGTRESWKSMGSTDTENSLHHCESGEVKT